MVKNLRVNPERLHHRLMELAKIGETPNRGVSRVAFTNEDIQAYLELHIEQGAVLESENLQIGVVEGIVGINWWDILIEGKANHAGTTPMNYFKRFFLICEICEICGYNFWLRPQAAL